MQCLAKSFFKQNFTAIIIVMLLLATALPAASAACPDPKNAGVLGPFQRVACSGGLYPPSGSGEDYTAADLAIMIGDIISVVLSFVGVAFIILTIYGGFLWMTARGNSQQVEQAQQLIRNSIIGIIVIFSVFAISRTVLLGLSTVVSPQNI